jgi:hypothetical protein
VHWSCREVFQGEAGLDFDLESLKEGFRELKPRQFTSILPKTEDIWDS